MAASQSTWANINDFSSIGKKRNRELGCNAQHTVLMIDPNHLTVVKQLLLFPMHMHLDRKVHARTRFGCYLGLEVNTRRADVTRQALKAPHFNGQLGIEPVSAPPMCQRGRSGFVMRC